MMEAFFVTDFVAGVFSQFPLISVNDDSQAPSLLLKSVSFR